MKYVDLPHNKKLNLLNDHDGGWKNLEQSKWCLHCGQSFTGLAVRAYLQNGQLWLECGTEGCDGSPIDWAPYPWWDENHPATLEWLRKQESGELDDENDDSDPSSGGIPF
jgi:hypothetical protein